MKVLLINPSWDRYVSSKGRRINRAWPPLDLLNCASILERENIQVDLIDARASWQAPEEIARKCGAYDQVFITSSPLDRWQCPNLEIDLFLENAKHIKHPELYVMGVHGTHFPDLVLDQVEAKALILGEPEWTILDIAKQKPLAEIQGIAYRVNKKGSNLRTAMRILGDLKQLPIPAFHLLNWEGYGYELMGDSFVLLETTRGCPFPCTYCQREMFGGRAYRYKDPRQVGQEVKAALDAGAKTGYFIDLEFSLNREYVLNVCQEIMPWRTRWKWCCQTRADSVNEELLHAMKAAGCDLIHFGVETGSARVMERIEKKITLDQVEKGVTMVKAAGMRVACFFMGGLPEETPEDRELTTQFALKINPTYASFHVATPYPDTPLYASRSWKTPYPESFYEGRDLHDLRRWEKQAYLRYYLRPKYLVGRALDGGFPQLVRQAKLLLEMI